MLAKVNMVGAHALVGPKEEGAVEGSHQGVIEPFYTLFCLVMGWCAKAVGKMHRREGQCP